MAPALKRITYGPVPSRRLGRSLGIDLLPMKTCSYDCIYCQLGPTRRTRLRRARFIEPERVVQAVRQALEAKPQVDVLTLSGSGEPTLERGLGEIIRLLKKFFSLPVSVITNSSLLYRRSLREELAAADLVLPSMDGWTEPTFKRINRPHNSLELGKILEGLVALRKEFRGEIWLEVLLVHEINDDPDQIPGLLQWVQRINPDRVQLNTVSRPPAEAWVRASAPERIQEIRNALGPRAEVVASFKGLSERGSLADLERRVAETLKRRPLCAEDLRSLFGMELARAEIFLEDMAKKNSWRAQSIGGKTYYRPVGNSPRGGGSSP